MSEIKPNLLKDPTDAAKHLEEAFAIFYAESQKLESQQASLQEKINQLSFALQESNQRLGVLMNAIPAGVILLENNVVKLHNPAVLQFLPKLLNEQIFQIPKEWQASIAPGEYLIYGEQEQGNPKTAKSNQPFKTIQVIRIDQGDRSFVQIQDITANIALHQANQRENRLTAMGRMAAGIAHQFRTPLATALLYSSHLCDDQIDTNLAKEFAQRLRKQLLDLEKLSQDMLRFISNRPIKTSAVSVVDIIAEAQASIQPLFDKKHVKLAIQCEVQPAVMLLVEPKSISNALIAILENALEVSEENQQVQIDARLDATKVNILITDQGPGIPSQMLDSLFEPFSTTHANGTGLGLSIAKNSLEAHRGTIAVQSSSAGAQFTLSIPYLQQQSN